MLADLVFVDLASEHADLIEAFDSGEPAMDDWLRRHGVMNATASVSRTVLALRGGDLVGYYALSMTQVLKEELPPGAGWRRMPRYPIGAILLGRLAVDRRWQSHGYGTDLLVAACVDAVADSKLVAARYLVSMLSTRRSFRGGSPRASSTRRTIRRSSSSVSMTSSKPFDTLHNERGRRGRACRHPHRSS